MQRRFVLIPGLVRELRNALALWTAWRWAIAFGIALAAAILSGVPTGIVPSPLYHRMTPLLWWDYPFWAVRSVLLGLLAASYAKTPVAEVRPDTLGRGVGAGVMSTIRGGMPDLQQDRGPSWARAARCDISHRYSRFWGLSAR